LGDWHVPLRAWIPGVCGFEICIVADLVDESLGDFGALHPLEQKLKEPTGRGRRRIGGRRTGHSAKATNQPDGFGFNLEGLSEP
jgi:hypothetical protein